MAQVLMCAQRPGTAGVGAGDRIVSRWWRREAVFSISRPSSRNVAPASITTGPGAQLGDVGPSRRGQRRYGGRETYKRWLCGIWVRHSRPSTQTFRPTNVLRCTAPQYYHHVFQHSDRHRPAHRVCGHDCRPTSAYTYDNDDSCRPSMPGYCRVPA